MAIPLFIPLWVFQLTSCKHKPLVVVYQFSKVLLGVFSIQKCWVTILAVIGIKDLSVMLYTYIFSPNNPYCTSSLFGKYVILCCMKNAIYYTKLNLICLLLHIQSDTFKLSSHLKFQISQPFFSHIQLAFFHQRHILMPCNTWTFCEFDDLPKRKDFIAWKKYS